jgi:hypothetical protein
LLNGEDLVEERAVGTTDQALALAELWRSHPPRGAELAAQRSPRHLPPPPAARPRRPGSAAVPRVMWVDGLGS